MEQLHEEKNLYFNKFIQTKRLKESEPDKKMKTSEIKIIEVTAENISDVGVYCIKDKKSPGRELKIDWFKKKINNGLKIRIVVDNQDKQLGFIEYLPSEISWRPIKAKNYLFIQCIGVFGKESRNKGIASLLLKQCENDAVKENKCGVCVISSDGPWFANKKLFENRKN